MNLSLPPIVGILSAAWLVLFVWARAGTERIKKHTTDLILEQAKEASHKAQQPSVEQFYGQFQPAWEKMLRETSPIILHKSELFPVPARPEVVRKRLNFTAAWMGAYLRVNGYHWQAAEELEGEIQRILALVPPKRAVR